MLRCLTMLPQHVRGICSRITHGVSPHAPYGSQPSSGQSQRDSMIVQNPRGISLTFVEKTQQTKTQLDQLAVLRREASLHQQFVSGLLWKIGAAGSFTSTFGNHNF